MTDPRRLAVVAAAAGELGQGDVPKYWASCKVRAPYPKHWCGGLALWAIHEAELALDVPWVIARGFCEVRGLRRTKSPEPGDVAYTDKPWQHHAIVESWDGTTLVTIDGNQGAPEPVRRRSRPMPKSGITFYSIDKFLGAPSAPVTPPKKTEESPAPGAESKAPVKEKTAPAPAAFDTGARILGIDVSHYQAPSAMKYDVLAKTHRFVIVNATDGTKVDSAFLEHVRRAQDAGLIVGAYHFFRPVHAVDAQLDAFGALVEKAGMGPGWLVPALDVEQNVKYDGPVTEERYNDECQRIAETWRASFGRALVYTNPAMWNELGDPRWLEEHALWISHYEAKTPRTPLGLPWVIWQHSGTGRLPAVHGGPLDLNVAHSLPLIDDFDFEPIPLAVDWAEHTRDRDAAIRDEDE